MDGQPKQYEDFVIEQFDVPLISQSYPIAMSNPNSEVVWARVSEEELPVSSGAVPFKPIQPNGKKQFQVVITGNQMVSHCVFVTVKCKLK